jgi:hypothetical protein
MIGLQLTEKWRREAVFALPTLAQNVQDNSLHPMAMFEFSGSCRLYTVETILYSYT